MIRRRFTCLSHGASSACILTNRHERNIMASVMVILGLLAALSPALSISMPTRGATVTTADGTGSELQPTALSDWASLIASQAGELRQLDYQTVPVQIINRNELREMLLQDFEEESDEIDITQDLLVLLDLLDEGQNLREITVEAYAQDILGFYDPEKDELCLVSETDDLSPLDKLTLAHEYAHAIQDQHFDLTSLSEQSADSEASMALDALVEGDATVVMALYYASYLNSEEQATISEMTSEPGMEPDADVPSVIQETMNFPYQYGMTFVIALIRKGRWEAVNQAYSDPPKSTEQIMHPEKYVQDRDDPVVVTLPNMATALGHEWSELDSDVFGEFSLKLYLEASLNPSEAERAAAGWGGDRYSFLEDSAGRKAFVLKSEWDTEDDARVFYEACTDRAREKGGSGALAKAREGKASAQWESEGLNYRFALEEGSVYLVIAPDAKTADKAVAAASGADKSSSVWMYVGLGIGLACLLSVIGVIVFVVRRRRYPKLAAESMVSQGGTNP